MIVESGEGYVLDALNFGRLFKRPRIQMFALEVTLRAGDKEGRKLVDEVHISMISLASSHVVSGTRHQNGYIKLGARLHRTFVFSKGTYEIMIGKDRMWTGGHLLQTDSEALIRIQDPVRSLQAWSN